MNKNFYKNKTILITGGTGSFGQSLVSFLLENKFPLKKIIIFSRDELKQHDMSIKFTANKKLRFLIGDIRDRDRLKIALKDVDYIIHAAALKQVPAAEYNPMEYIKTNIFGAQNLIECSIDNEVKAIIALSTDKASSPLNLYGATKLCSDKLFVSANNIKGKKKIKFVVVRYGNVMGSRGSVLRSFAEQKKNNKLNITDLEMTRFNLDLEEAISCVLWALENSIGGEIIVPKIPSFRIIDLAKAVCEKCKIIITGIRPGEKLHEEMISTHDSINTVELKDHYIILPNYLVNFYLKNKKAKIVNKNFSLRSDKNKFISNNDLKKIIKKIL